MKHSDPFCDFIGVTVPAEVWDSLREDVESELQALGMGVEVDEERAVLWRTSEGHGTVKANRVGKVWALGASGSVCAGLRAAGRFNDYLAAIAIRPHRVTRIDASIDVQADAAPLVAGITRAGRAGGLSLTRKSVKPSDVTTFLGVRADGVETGTVYVGARRADVRLVAYDKQHERAARKLPDVGPLTRYELRLRSGTGVTLRDAAMPASVFWHFLGDVPMVTSLRPEGVPQWTPEGSGFVLERTAPPLPAQRLKRRVEQSADLRALVALAEACGPYGVELLVSHIRSMAGRGAGVSPAVTLDTSQAA